MIAGNADAKRRQPKGIVSWSCGAVGGKPRFFTIPACTADQMLQLQVTFPNCWDGRRLDSADHQQHMKYAARGLCPASHPVALPQLILIVLYPPVPLGLRWHRAASARMRTSSTAGTRPSSSAWSPSGTSSADSKLTSAGTCPRTPFST